MSKPTYTHGMSTSKKRFGETAGLSYGARIVVTVGDVSASAMYVAGIGNQRFTVKLDGTGQTVTVDGYTITKEK